MSYPKDFTEHCKGAVVGLELACVAGVLSEAWKRWRRAGQSWALVLLACAEAAPREATCDRRLWACSPRDPRDSRDVEHTRNSQKRVGLFVRLSATGTVSAASVQDMVLITAFLVEIAEMQLLK